MAKKEFELSQENYFSPDRPHVSNSMINSYLKDPEFYKLKHIDRTVKFVATDPMKKGSIVDAMLTQPDNNPYRVEFKRTCFKKDNAKQYDRETKIVQAEKATCNPDHLVSKKLYEEAADMAMYLEKQPFWKEGLETATFQDVLIGELEGVKVCGMTDRIDSLGNQRWRISDVKITSAIKIGKNPTKWMYNSYDMGYIRAAALYRYLWAELQGVPVKNVDFAHIVGYEIAPGIPRVKLYNIEPESMDVAMDQVRGALKKIKKKKFKSTPVKWSDIE